MKAIVYLRYGSPDVLQYAEIAKPIPANNEVLIRVYAASVNPLDRHFMRGTARVMTGLIKPKRTRLGVDVAGAVEAVGGLVTHFKPGDAVFGASSGKSWTDGVGSFAEYTCAAENKLVLKPANISFEEAAAVPIAAITALQGLRDHGGIEAGQKVLIDGASGGVGTFAIQIAKAFGAQVTAACSTRNQEKARLLGADRVIDYSQEDCTRGDERYDLILAANAYYSSRDYQRVLTPNGICVVSGGKASLGGVLLALLTKPFAALTGPQKTRTFMAKIIHKDLTFLAELLEAGKVVPVIDRRYPLSETAAAIRYLEEGHAQGKIVITVA
jgi:NADPH:quinone reductase-like Zn-dependent oxidoreductase